MGEGMDRAEREELEAVVRDTHAVIEAALRRQCAALASLERAEATVQAHGLSTRTWLARECGLPARTARDRVGVGVAVSGAFDELGSEWAEGAIGFAHVATILELTNPRIHDVVVQNQELLAGLSKGTVFEQWRREARALMDFWDLDGGHDPRDDEERNELHLTPVGTETVVSGRLVSEAAAIVEQTLGRKADELVRRHLDDPDVPLRGRARWMADALVEICQLASGRSVEDTCRPQPTVVVKVRAGDPNPVAAPIRDPIHEPALGDVARLPRLGDGTYRTLECDPVLRALIVDSLGTPLDLGRTVRLVTPAQRIALAERDGGCIFPGCPMPAGWTDAHHVVHWAHDGRTDLDNLAPLCRFHHGLVHSREWRLEPTGDGWFTWTTPTGQQLDSQRHGRRRPPPGAREPERQDLPSARRARAPSEHRPPQQEPGTAAA
jgi:hypothetical protein